MQEQLEQLRVRVLIKHKNLWQKRKNQQTGISLIFFALILVIVFTTSIFVYLDSSSIANDRDKRTAIVLADAKATLIGFAINKSSVSSPPYLPNPDFNISSEGYEAGSVGTIGFSLIGKFPWRSLGTAPFRDGWNECLWYAVSGRFKKSPPTTPFNWDTQGQIDVVDKNGNTLAANLAAIIISPGPILNGQERSVLEAGLPQCGGNYSARNYLDTFDAVNSIAGEVNYLGGTNYRVASNDLNKTFVLAKNDYYNDWFVFITSDDIFDKLITRSSFSTQITALLNDNDFITYLQYLEITAGDKGTGNLACTNASAANQEFCNNWKEMLLLKQLSAPTATCSRVLIFGGRVASGQSRITSVQKDNPSNYLELPLLTSFLDPDASDTDFLGSSSTFDKQNPTADILKCIPLPP
jgi:hypothetical protein